MVADKVVARPKRLPKLSSRAQQKRTQEAKKARRAVREAELAEAIEAGNLNLPTAQFGVILADPPWQFKPYSRETGLAKSPDNHYATTPTEDIAEIPVGDMAAPDSVLFLWATQAMLPQALHVMAKWGFDYKSQFIWHKEYSGKQTGLGYWNRSVHEILLIGTRGKVPAPSPGMQWRSIVAAAVREHSVKPDWCYELIEHYFPTLPKIEMFARRGRPGWAVWGAGAPPHDPDTGAAASPP